MVAALILISLLSTAAAAPQYTVDNTDSVDNVDPDIVKDIFGTAGLEAGGAYSGGSNDNGAAATAAASNIGVVVNIVQENQPADYLEPTSQSGPEDKATVEVSAQFETCAEYTEQFGYMCVPYYQCSNGTIITDGAGLIDVRNGFGALSPEDSKCPGFLDVCCKDPDFVPPPPPKITHTPRCGRRNTAGVGARIQGFKDGESQFAEWPHMCAVLHDKKDENGESTNLYKCGGSLIAPGVVLTAAHCINDLKPFPEQLKVRCGEWDTQNTVEPYPHQDRYGADVKIHPEFNPRNLANDFALIFMQEEFSLDFHVDTICLPQPGTVFDSSSCFATGWGKDKFGSAGQYQVVLKEVDLNTVPKDTCQNQLRTTRLGQKFKLDESFMCAGGEKGKDTCKGDGGSPLVCPRKSDPTHYEQAGIVAWGIGCGENGVPGVYADVGEGVCWIDYAMSCYYGQASGDYNTYWGYSSDQCGAWLSNKLASLDKKIEAEQRFAKIYELQRSEYTQCQVNWLTAIVEEGQASGPYTNGGSGSGSGSGNEDLDLGGFERDASGYNLGNSGASPQSAPTAEKLQEDGAGAGYAGEAAGPANAEVIVEVAKEAPAPGY